MTAGPLDVGRRTVRGLLAKKRAPERRSGTPRVPGPGADTGSPQVLRAESGHLLLVGESGVGKSVLTKFVAWNGGLSLIEIQATRHYTPAKFDDDLRAAMRRAGVDRERLVVTLDEADEGSSAFLERMNALLASGEVPGLWGADDLQRLLAACRDARRSDGAADDDDAAVLRWFARNVRRNLHVVFCLNPGGSGGLADRATASPALFNRCVVDWFGTWSTNALTNVAKALVKTVDFGAIGAAEWADGLSADLAARLREEPESDDSDDDEEVIVTTDPTLESAVVAALVETHELRRAASRATCRDFVELARCFAAEATARREALEATQKRKAAGLRELARARGEVAAMQGELAAQNKALEAQEASARDQLEKMVADQQAAEAKQARGKQLSAELALKGGDIASRKKAAEEELAQAEPALLSARKAVQGIKKTQLDELRSLRNPPIQAKRTLEAVAVILGALPVQRDYSWDDVRKAARQSDFIKRVVEFNPRDMGEAAAKAVRDRYLSPSAAYLDRLNAKERETKGEDAPEIVALDFEAANRSSAAAGPLVLWAGSQLDYVEIERKVEPLQKEVEALEAATKTTRDEVATLEREMAELEKSVKGYKEAYATAVRAAEKIKNDMASGKVKADRAARLLASLADEQGRWAAEADAYPDEARRVPSRALIAAADVAYGGALSEAERASLRASARRTAAALGLPDDGGDDARCSPGACEGPGRARRWHEKHGLPRDDRFVANANILAASTRASLLIDPTGAALRFAASLLEKKRARICSAAEPGFERTLATAARFGTALIVRDVDEAWDAVAHPLLNKEFRKGGSGGASSARIGGDAVDVSPDFELVLHARDRAGAAGLPLNLLGRVTVLDFSTTRSSLRATALSRFVRAQRPELERERVEAARELEKQQALLQTHEDQVLAKIAGSSSSRDGGGLLDDGDALNALEAAKAEASDAAKNAERLEKTAARLSEAAEAFGGAATFAADLFGVLSRLEDVHGAYAYALDDFLDHALFSALEKTPPAEPGEDAATRFDRLTRPLIYEASRRVAGGLLRREHRAAAAVAVAALVSRSRSGDEDLSNALAGRDVLSGDGPAARLADAARRGADVAGAAFSAADAALDEPAARAWRGREGGVAAIAEAAADADARLSRAKDARERARSLRRRRRSSDPTRIDDDEPPGDARALALDALAAEVDLAALATPVVLVATERNSGRDGAREAEAAAAPGVVETIALGDADGEAKAGDALAKAAERGSWLVRSGRAETFLSSGRGPTAAKPSSKSE